jgi:hypothetical protein
MACSSASLDREFLRRNNKTQNLGRRDVMDDIAYAESKGIGITYGYLFDPRHQTAAEMEPTDALPLYRA